jgi:membrane protease YdiL (CAAX protease family)
MAGFLAGLAYGLSMARRGRIADAILAHAVTNALIAGVVVVGDRWSPWS